MIRRTAATLALLSVLTIAASAHAATPQVRARAVAAPTSALLPLHAVRGTHPGIFDATGRQVLLRGVNLNSLGDYYQDDPAQPPTVPVTEADWAAMAAQGFDVVRLIVSWSLLEPTKGAVDPAYLARIHAAVDAAAAHGIYTVIDMHQDAWGKFIASPPGVVCPAGLHPAIGWDGAPEWATLTDGAQTCNPGFREGSEAVLTAWDSFWSNRQGIRTELVRTWGAVARSFANDPAVAGFDLLNEPGVGHDGAASLAGLTSFSHDAIVAIRAGEAGAGGWAHPIMFEYDVVGHAIPASFTTDPGIVFAGHNYGDSISPVPLALNWAYVTFLAGQYQTAIWTGEYGWFTADDHASRALSQYATFEDANLSGSAWWQWRQACGDPHSIGSPGGVPAAVLIHYNENDCPGDVNRGPVARWQVTVGRPYPRAAAGRLVKLSSNGATRTLAFTATAARAGGSVDLWVPDHGLGAPVVGGTGVAAVRTTAVDGGFRVDLTVCAPDYTVRVGSGTAAPAACPAVPVTTSPGTAPPTAPAPAEPVVTQPTYTG